LSAFKTKQFKELQAHWYGILKKQGFEEIEDVNSPREYLKRWEHIYFAKTNYHQRRFDAKEAYYSKAAEYLHSYNFASMFEKEVWRLHSEGQSVRKIAIYFKTQGIRTNKDYVANIIRCIQVLVNLELTKKIKVLPSGQLEMIFDD
jgi:hypothetical protein